MSAAILRVAAEAMWARCDLVGEGDWTADDSFFLGVADWLNEAAEHLDDHSGFPAHHVCPTAREGLDCSVLAQALVVARAYLGESA